MASTGYSCRSPLKIGLTWSDQDPAAFAAVGAGSDFANGAKAYEANLKKMYQVGADDLNKRGGIGGCQIQLVWSDVKQVSDTYPQQQQQACSELGDDQHVFAVFPMVREDNGLEACMAPRHVIVLEGGSGGVNGNQPNASFLSKYRGLYYGTAVINYDRLGPAIDMLHKAGFFGKGAKVGILRSQDPAGENAHLANDIWKPRLATYGIPVASTFAYPQPQSVAQFGDLANTFQSAVLQFQRAGVSHVLILPYASEFFLFARDADSQGYHPRLGLTDYAYPGIMSLAPTASAHGAMDVSWTPGQWQTQTKPPSEPSNSARDRCISLYKKPAQAANQSPAAMLPWCDVLNFLHNALVRVTVRPTAALLLHAVEGLNSTFQSAEGFGPTRFSPNRYDGATQAQVMAWDTNTTTWQNASSIESVP